MNQLRPYQSDLVEQLRAAWREGFKAPCIVLPCGGGKSCILAEIARRTTANGKRVLFLVHRRELVEQIIKTFVSWGVDMRFCEVMMVQTAARLILRESPTQQSEAELRRAGRGKSNLKSEKILPPKLIMTDENHHSPAASYKKIYEKFPETLRVGVTATPTRLNGSGLADVNDKLIIGVSAKWLIENNCLAPYDYYAPDVADLTGLKTKRGEFITSDIEKAMIKKAVFGDVIAYYKRLAAGRKSICYCASIKHSMAMAEEFSAAGISAAHIDGETPAEERARIISRFRSGEIRILCNVDLISEGFDVPDCECAILLRPTQSLTLYIQQSMRCMRYREGKRAVIIDHVGNYARFGLPDDDREWSLEGKPKKRREQQENIKAKMCPECFLTFSPPEKGEIICPHCGYIFPQKERREIEQTTGELHKIEGFRIRYDRPEDCNTYKELLEYAKRHNYKAGWAYHMAVERGIFIDRA